MRKKRSRAETLRPLSFMYVAGLSSQKLRPPSSTFVTHPENFDSFFQDAFLRAAISSTQRKPALWRVRSYSLPGCRGRR
jgi:hypothetical protein